MSAKLLAADCLTPNSSIAISPGQVWPDVFSPKVAVIEN